MGRPIRIVIADDHPVVRDGLRRLLEIEPDIKIIGEAASGAEAIALAQSLHPDVLLLDLMMPGVSGLDALRESHMQEVAEEMHILVLTAVADRRQLVEAVRMRVHGIVSKDEAIDKLLKAVRAVAAGQYWIERELLAEAVQSRSEQRRARFGLSPRELEIISTVTSGASNKELADKLSISELTVKRHLTNIYQKLGVSSRLELALFAITNQIRPPHQTRIAG
jgi:two-component system, NarL family, nitrate/nitrite response regulator NarL